MVNEGWEASAREALSRLAGAIYCDFCALGLLEGADRELKWRLAFGNGNERFLSIAERLGGGMSGSVVKVGRAMSMQLTDLLAARRIHEYPILLAESLRSAFAVPIVVGRDVVGVLIAGDRRRRIYRTEERAVVAAAAERIGELLAGRQAESATPQGDMVE
ncbi:GAF domain-containing protein [Cohnella sp. GCM10027633]|uniref:GAF domain-containing protein n=1 Tax=unclassified Cohnella TaxID=2636738 RepID=UPI00363149A0